eukprot:CAMPEP_0117445606 /NCGR_PEP_ID=MMETSP0759-20121206/5888_1 /TAXON_ID=63605 /ORGANISM="Percolomonas cosmopolitus, Strain WS" /LENGTH=480 /DNA_ID=CAMNT_0005237799 /DNA_START=174 /DNA_END=1616 /DNA_ORIENTATION=-
MTTFIFLFIHSFFHNIFAWLFQGGESQWDLGGGFSFLLQQQPTSAADSPIGTFLKTSASQIFNGLGTTSNYPHHRMFTSENATTCAFPIPVFESGDAITITSVFIFTTFLWHTLFMITLLVRHCVALRHSPGTANSGTNSHHSNHNSSTLSQNSHPTPTRSGAAAYGTVPSTPLLSRLTPTTLSSMNTKSLLYISLVFFSTCRLIYFLLEIIRLIDRNEQMVSKQLEWVALGLYHMASTWFYTAFMILALNWAEEYLTAAQLYHLSSKKFYKPKWLLVLFNVFIHSMEMIILAVFVSFSVFDLTLGSNILNVIQLLYHSMLCFCVVILFVAWIIFARKQRVQGLDFESSYGYRVLFYTAVIVCFIIVLKGVVNLMYGILRVVALISFIDQDGNVCVGTDVMVVSVGALLLDLIPVAIVVFVWKSPSVEQPDDPNLSKTTRIIMASPSGSYDDVHHLNVTQPIMTRRRNFSDDGAFVYTSV